MGNEIGLTGGFKDSFEVCGLANETSDHGGLVFLHPSHLFGKRRRGG